MRVKGSNEEVFPIERLLVGRQKGLKGLIEK